MAPWISRSLLQEADDQEQLAVAGPIIRQATEARQRSADLGQLVEGLAATWRDEDVAPATAPPSQPSTAPADDSGGFDLGGLLSSLTATWRDPEPPKPSPASVSPDSSIPRTSGAGVPQVMPTARQPGLTSGPAPAQPMGEIAEGDPARFFETARPYAEAVERETGVPAVLSLAIAANETGYGQRRYMAGANNYHGIQARAGEPGAVPYKDWRPGAGGQQEFYNAAQRSFADPAAGFRGFADFLTSNPRYAPALAKYKQSGDVNQLAADIHAAGYAEDPAYTTKITSIIRGIPVKTGVGEVTDTRGVGLAQQRPAPTTPPQAEQTPAAQGQAFAAGSYTPNQIEAATSEGLDYETALAVCGPAAAIAFARRMGRNPTMQEAVQLAREVGWTAAAGMAGPASQKRLLDRLGVASRLQEGVPDWRAVAADVQRGNPVTISTPGHYFVAERYDPESGAFDFGQSAAVLKASGGRRWFKPEELVSLGMGDARASLFIDSPESPTPSVVAGRSQTAGSSPAGPSSVSPAAATPSAAGDVGQGDMPRVSLGAPAQETGIDYGDGVPNPMPGTVNAPSEVNPRPLPGAVLLPGPGVTNTVPNAPEIIDRQTEQQMYRQPLGDVPMRDRWADEQPSPYDPRDADSGPREALPVQEDSKSGPIIVPFSSSYENPDAGPREAPPGSVGAGPVGPLYGPEPVAAPVSPYDTDQPFRPTPRLGTPASQIVSPPIAEAPNLRDPNDTREIDQGPRESPRSTPPTTWYGQAAETGLQIIAPAVAAMDAANEWIINHPIAGRFNLQGAGRELAGTEQIYQETREDQQRLEALIRRFRAGDTSVEPEIQALTASLNRRTQADRASMLAAGERNPDKTAEGLGQVVQGAAAFAIAPGLAAGPVRNVVAGALDPVGQGLGAGIEAVGPAARAATRGIRGAGNRVAEGLAQNARNVARADARMAAEGSTTAPGTLGILTGNPLEANRAAGTRIIPPHVVDTLEDFPVRIPDDPAFHRAVEAAGGTIDPEKGVTFPVIRGQGEDAAGEVAARGGPFYEAGERSSYIDQNPTNDPNKVGGTQQIGPAPTRYRSPLVLSAPPGESQGFDEGMRQLGARGIAPDTVIRELEDNLAKAERLVSQYPRTYSQTLVERATQALEEARGRQTVTAALVDDAVREARKAGPEGSRARAQALKDVVSRFGGDPDLIDDLLAIRGSTAEESSWAIKENILSHQARQAKHDGVITVQSGFLPEISDIQKHPKVIAAKAEWDSVQPDLERAKARAIAAGDYEAINKASAEFNEAWLKYQAVRDAVKDELSGHRITELQDVREATNPTPGEPEALVRAREAAATARQQWQDARDAGNWEQATEAYDRLDQAWKELDAVQQQKLPPGPGGFTLRDDVKPRAQREAEAAAEAARQTLADQAFNHPDVQAAGQKALAADAALKVARASGDQDAIMAAQTARAEAYSEHGRIQRQVFQELQAGSTTAQGITPQVDTSSRLNAGFGVMPDETPSRAAPRSIADTVEAIRSRRTDADTAALTASQARAEQKLAAQAEIKASMRGRPTNEVNRAIKDAGVALTKQEEAARLGFTGQEEVVDVLREGQVIPSQVVAGALGQFPSYLRGVTDFIVEQRQKLVGGTLTPRDVSKAYVHTVGSMQAGAQGRATLERKLGRQIGDLYVDQGKVRPEEAIADWFFTPAGKRALDAIEAGTVDRAAWDDLLQMRDAYGNNTLRNMGVFGPKSRITGQIDFDAPIRRRPDGTPLEYDIRNIGELTERLNAARGDTVAIMQEIAKVKGIGAAKPGFIKHLLGLGNEATFDAVEMNLWLTGKGDTGRLTGPSADMARAAKLYSDDPEVTRLLFDQIRSRFDELRASGVGSEIDPSVFNHIMHHWIWDSAKGLQTTHAGMYEAMRNAATMGVLPDAATRTADPLSAVNRALGQGVMSSVSGGVGAQINQEMNPDDPYAGAKGFVAGAVGPVAAARGVRAIAGRRGARMAAEGALATLGDVPSSRRPLLPGFESIDPLTDPVVPPTTRAAAPWGTMREALPGLIRQLQPGREPKLLIDPEDVGKANGPAEMRATGSMGLPTLEQSPNLLRRVRDATQPWVDRVNILRYAGMLSDTASQVFNLQSNVLLGARDVALTPIAAGIDAGRVGLGRTGLPGLRKLGTEREVFFGEVPARLAGMRAGSRVGLQPALEILQSGMTAEQASKLTDQHAAIGFASGSGKVDLAAELPLRALAASDAVFRSSATGGHLMAEAYAAAKKANGGKTPTEAMIREAAKSPELLERVQKLAARSVLQEDRAVTDAYQKFVRALGPLGLPIQVEVPFVKTPYNVMAQGMGMTPAGLAGLIQDMGMVPGDPRRRTAREIEHRLAGVALGTAIMAGAATSVAAGEWTGPYPSDAKERSTLPPGWRPWSKKVEVGGQTYYAPLINVMGPLGMPIVASILAHEAEKSGKGRLSPEWAGAVAAGVGRYALQNSFFEGVANIAKVMDERTGASAKEQQIEQIARQFSPHVLGGGALGTEIQRIMGMPARDPEGALEALLATHPAQDAIAQGLGREPVEPAQDVLGRERSMGLGGPAGAVVRAGVEDDAAVIAAFRSAGEGLPTRAPNSVNDPSTGRPRVLTAGQKHRWRRVFGSELRTRWNSAGAPRDPKALQTVEAEAREAATQTILGRR